MKISIIEKKERKKLKQVYNIILLFISSFLASIYYLFILVHNEICNNLFLIRKTLRV